MSVFLQVFKANARELLRDKSALFWFLLFPLIFVFIFGMVFSNSGDISFSLGIIVQTDSPVGNGMVSNIKSIPSFNVSIERDNPENELDALKRGERQVVLELPDINYQDIQSGRVLDIPLYYDASRQQTNQVLISVIKDMFNEAEHQITGQPGIFKLKPQPIQTENLTGFDYILPGILGMALMQLGLFGSLQFLELREKKIIRGLGVTPLSRGTLLGSEILLRLIMALFQTILIIFIGQAVFNVTIINSLYEVFAVVILGSITFISLGYMLVSFVRSSEAGNGIIQVVQFPMMFLSGTFFPTEIMPEYIQPIVKILPLTYLADALRQVMNGSSMMGLSLSTDILVLCGWLVITLLISIKFWRWD